MVIELPEWTPTWRQIFLFVIPVALSPIATLSTEGRCGYVVLVMALFWMFELLPYPVTALIPVFALPLLGVLSSQQLTTAYMKETNMMFLGGMTAAAAVEYSNLHTRIALFIILNIGQSPRRLMTGIMVTTMFLSMWMSNTATTAMMVPIVDAILQQLYLVQQENSMVSMVEDVHHNPVEINERKSVTNLETEGENSLQTKKCEMEKPTSLKEPMFASPPNEECRRLKDMCYLATAYAANLGGTGVITGTGPNLVLKNVLDESYEGRSPINFATWMLHNVPVMLICGVLSWFWLQIYFIRCRGRDMFKMDEQKETQITKMLRRKYDQLGRMTFHEIVVFTLFTALVLLWLFKSPGFVPGWAQLFTKLHPDIKIGDSVPAIFIVILLFIIPKNPKIMKRFLRQHINKEQNEIGADEDGACLNWKVVESRVPWGVILLLGGGNAIAEGVKHSNLTYALNEQLSTWNFMSKEAFVLLICLLTASVTECVSNITVASILLPLLKDLATALKINPIYFLLPTTLCCSFAFMLPAATAPNAIVMGAAGMKSKTLVQAGFMMNIICVGITLLFINTWGVFLFDLNTYPDWANTTLDET